MTNDIIGINKNHPNHKKNSKYKVEILRVFQVFSHNGPSYSKTNIGNRID
ncbi:hypothetical protein GCM10028791_13930 [Echinicola sediminis]